MQTYYILELKLRSYLTKRNLISVAGS